MTCIAAIKKGELVVIGGESLINQGSDKKAGVRKITKFPGCYIGFAGILAIRHVLDQLAENAEFLSTFRMESIEDARDLARRVFSTLKEELEDEAREDIEETSLLIATTSKIFEVDSHITCIEHEKYAAIGSGGRPAKAAMEVLSVHYPLTSIRDICIIALDSACSLDLYCLGPYYIYEVENESPDERATRTKPTGESPNPPRSKKRFNTKRDSKSSQFSVRRKRKRNLE